MGDKDIKICPYCKTEFEYEYIRDEKCMIGLVIVTVDCPKCHGKVEVDRYMGKRHKRFIKNLFNRD